MSDLATPSEVPIGITRAKAPEPELTGRPITGERYYSAEFAQAEWDAL